MTDPHPLSERTDSTERVALSYPLSLQTPIPKGGQPAKITPVSRLHKGDLSNTSLVQFWNHSGTHVDGPGHMLKSMGPFTHYCPPTGLFLIAPVLIQILCRDSQVLTSADLEPYRAELKNCDLLLLRTGFDRIRTTAPERYRTKNPGIASSFARFVVENCSRLVCLGIDTISFAAAENLSAGIDAHKILFQRQPPVLLIEDMNLSIDSRRLQRVIVLPWFVEGLDSCPCTVIAELRISNNIQHPP